MNNKKLDSKEIKFRVWVKGTMITNNQAIVENFKHCYNNYTLMQYTGLKDVNEKEIYEEDILTIWIGGHKQDSYYLVEDLRKFYQLCNCKDVYYRIEKCKIIGNKYKNPGLLKEG